MPPGSPRRSLLWRLVPVAALLALTLVLRAPVTIVSPVLGEVRADLGLDAAAAGLLTSVPVFCFGLLTPAASRLLRSTGINHGALYCLGAIIAGSILRSSAGVGAAFAGTVLLGVGMTIGNLVVPMLIGRQFRHRAELLSSAYTATVNIAVTTTMAAAVPLATAVGWRWAIALPGVALGTLALVFWLLVYPPGVRGAHPAVRRRAGLPDPAPAAPVSAASAPSPASTRLPRPLRRLTILLTVAFSAHTLAYYAVTAWLPSALAELRGMTALQAGAAASLFQAAGVVGPLLVPVLAGPGRWSSRRILVAVAVGWASLPAGMLLAPALWPVWSVAAGMAQGAFFAAIMAVLIRRARTVDENRRAVASMQTFGYCVAAVGPVLVGWMHQQVAGWTAPFLVMLAMVVVMGVTSIVAVRAPATD